MLARQALARSLAAVAVAIGAAVLWLSDKPTTMLSGGVAALVSLALLALALGAALVARKDWERHGKAAVGARSERRVAKALAGGPWEVFNGALLGAGGDADHIIIGAGSAVVETKTGHGRVTTADGVMRAGSRRMPGDPIAQVRRQASAMARQYNLRPLPVVCVVDMSNEPFMSQGVLVCSLGYLVSLLQRQMVSESGELLARAAHDLRAKISGRNASRQVHQRATAG